MRRLTDYVQLLDRAIGPTHQMSDTELNELRGALRFWLAQCDAAEATNRAAREQAHA